VAVDVLLEVVAGDDTVGIKQEPYRINNNKTESNCTIHEVTEEVDGGPIIVQKVVKVKPDKMAESLKAKVQALKGPAFIEAIWKKCKTTVSYADVGVSIDVNNSLVELIKPLCKATRRPGCNAKLGGFGRLFNLAAVGYKLEDTIIISATDGMSTKLCMAYLMKKHESVGINLVAMCVNDLIVAWGSCCSSSTTLPRASSTWRRPRWLWVGLPRGAGRLGAG
jgi:hypothetical protein